LTVANRLVVDVGDVHHGADAVPQKTQCANGKILEKIRAQIADVGVVVRRGSAVVDLDFVLPERLERLDGARKRVVKRECHKRFCREYMKKSRKITQKSTISEKYT
jgi:hypothetical protein